MFILELMTPLPQEDRPYRSAPMIMLLVLMLLALALAAAWAFTPLPQLLNLSGLAAWIQELQPTPAELALVPLAFLVGGLLAVPFNAMSVLCILALGPLPGAPLALAGGLTNAAGTYLIGSWLGGSRISRLLGPRTERIRKHVVRRGLIAVIAIRVVPIAPFTMVNLVSGAAGIPLPAYLLGTALGLLPGTITLALLGQGLYQALASPQAKQLLLLLGLLLLALAAGVTLRALIHRWRARAVGGGDTATSTEGEGSRSGDKQELHSAGRAVNHWR